MLTAIGLSLDVVGAVTLTIGLFRPARPTVPGYAYAPDDAARDAAFGLVGATLLVAGFALQSLQYFGVAVECSNLASVIAAALALVAAVLYAYVVYGLTFLVVLRRRIREGRERWDGIDYPLMRQRKGLRFWHQVRRPPE